MSISIDDIKNMSAETLCDKETFISIEERDDEFEIEQLFGAASDRAKELRIGTKYKALLTAFKKQLKRGMLGSNSQIYTYKEKEYDLGSWITKENGVCRWSDRGFVYACPHMILPVMRLKNIETKEEKEIVAFRRDRWEEITVPKEQIASASKIVGLAKYGIAVTSENARYLVQYMADIENINDVKVQNSTSKYGWHGMEFIPFDKKVVFDAESKYRELNDSLEPKGSYQVWLDLVREIRRNTTSHYEPQLCMSAALASVLIKPLSMLPFILNIWGGSGKGKTVAIMLATSIWADPGEGRYLTDALSTQNAFEIREDILTDLPLLIDDFSKVRDRFDDGFSDLIYMICSGRGKARSNVDLGLNEMKTWSNVCISNMERPLIGENAKGGQINRVLDFEMDDGSIFSDGNAVVECIRGNYGYAGRDFITAIREMGFDSIKDQRKKYENLINDEAKKQERKLEEKQVLSLSILLTADKLATEQIFNDGIYLDLEKCVSQLKTSDDVQEQQRTYEFIMDMVEQNRNKFNPDENYRGEIWGLIKEGYVHINPVAFRKISTEGNFSIKAFCSWAKRMGLLKHTGGKLQNIVRQDGTLKRFYSIQMPSGIEVDAEGFVNITQDEIPFE